MSGTTRFLEPLDVLYLRGNRLFGDPGSYGESQVLPWPSVAAGAWRSRILVDDGVDVDAFARGEILHPTLGTPERPGTFTLTEFQLARQTGVGVETLFPVPVDLSLAEDKKGQLQVRRAHPLRLSEGLSSSYPLPMPPVLAENRRVKAKTGYVLRDRGWKRYLQGEVPSAEDFVPYADLWQRDERIGIGLNPEERCAEEGKLFTSQAVAFCKNVGYLTQVTGAELPTGGLLRFGGDGRAVAVRSVEYDWIEINPATVLASGRALLVLTTPGLFTQGWIPNGIQGKADGGYRFDLHGVQGTLVAAAVSRSEILSGWNLARWQPKAAQRVVPAGSVYWLENLQGSPESLRKLTESGLWGDPCEDDARRAEGLNRIRFGLWPN